MHIDERANDDKRAEYVPKPIIGCTERISDAAALELRTDAVGYLMCPNEVSDSESDRTYDKEEQSIVHRLFSVVSAAYYVYVVRYRGHKNKRIYTECDY